MNFIALILLAAGGLILTGGDLFMKQWVATNKPAVYLLGMLLYIIGLNFLAFSFKYKNIAVASVIFVLINILTLIAFSYFYWQEKLSGMEVVGLTLGVIAIVLLELADK